MTKINPSRRTQLVQLDTYAHNWGILVPCPSGFVWEQQTQGVMCNHVSVEGVYIPLQEPSTLLEALTELNYAGKNTDYIWQQIKESMKSLEGLEWEEVDNPDSSKYPDNQEGFQWIRITRWDNPLGRGKELEGQVVILIYPNSD